MMEADMPDSLTGGGIVSGLAFPLIVGHEQVLTPDGRITCQPVYATT